MQLYQSILDKLLLRLKKDGDRGDFWLTSLEAKEYGMIDEILTKNEKIKADLFLN